MRVYWLRLAPLALALGACTAGGRTVEGTPLARIGDLEVYDVYVPAPAADDVASVYFRIVNTGATDTLMGVRTQLGHATIHDVVTEEGRSHMVHLEALPLPARESVRLAPGGLHVMLTELKRRPAIGDTVALTLVFARAGSLDLRAPVLSYTDVVERLDSGRERP